MIENSEHETLTMSDICSSIGTSWRTLDRAFKERFGLGPKAYLQCYRLSSVRNEILIRRGDALITDIANDLGFWHMGQFARDYKLLFGELPSQSRQR